MTNAIFGAEVLQVTVGRQDRVLIDWPNGARSIVHRPPEPTTCSTPGCDRVLSQERFRVVGVDGRMLQVCDPCGCAYGWGWEDHSPTVPTEWAR